MESVTIDQEILNILLHDYSQVTGMPIGLYKKDRATFSALSRSVFSIFCAKFRELPPCLEACEADHSKRALEASSTPSSPEMCHAGLWNIAYPVTVDTEHIATLLCGQVLLVGQEEQSRKTFLKRAKELGIDQTEINELLAYFLKVPIITKSTLSGELFEHIRKTAEIIYGLAYDRIQLLKERELLERRITFLTHELLLPIQAVVANASSLLSEMERGAHCDYGYAKDSAVGILNEMKRFNVLAENLHSSFLIGQEYLPREYATHSIYRMLIRCWETYNAEATSKGVTLRKPAALSGTSPDMEMSLPNLERAFMNLIGNAVKYSYIGSSITDRYIDITCSHDRSFCTVVISNFGVGILPEEISAEKIFEPGYRGLLSKDRSRIGSGLGLSEAKRIIRELHHGTINVKSHDKLSGYKTSVTVVLPLRQLKGERE